MLRLTVPSVDIIMMLTASAFATMSLHVLKEQHVQGSEVEVEVAFSWMLWVFVSVC